jgi:hypothetical protein
VVHTAHSILTLRVAAAALDLGLPQGEDGDNDELAVGESVPFSSEATGRKEQLTAGKSKRQPFGLKPSPTNPASRPAVGTNDSSAANGHISWPIPLILAGIFR